MSGSVRVIAGVALGVALTLMTAAGVSAIRSSTTESVLGTEAVPGGAQIVSGANALALGCQPYESALVHRVALSEQPVVAVRCVMVSAPRPVPSEFQTEYTGGEAPAIRPVATTRSVAATAEPSVAARPVARQAREVASRPSGRSWPKTMMVIGGSTAAGAGVGGLVGGKKGALVGAAIGGGASTIYESVKR